MMTKEEMMQDLFNKMWRGLSGQNWQPASEHDACYYRMPDGRKCAVGHCIPSDMYNKYMEGLMVSEISVSDELGWNKWPLVMEFLEEAQSCHDYAAQNGQMKERFERLAADYGLTIPDVDVPL